MTAERDSRTGTRTDNTRVTAWRWLATTKQLQERSFGVEYTRLNGDALADYITWNTAALVAEVGEFLAEVGWKNWASPRGWVNRDQAIGELIDIGHFLANLAVALGVTDNEWEARYQRKQGINAQRQIDGYDGVSSKCPSCKRELAEVELIIVEGDRACLCGFVLDRDVVAGSVTSSAATIVEAPIVERIEVDGITLPCGHVVERPPDWGAVITCHCGKVYDVRPDNGGKSWKVQEKT